MSTPNYTYLPWVRYGLGNFISREDDMNDTAVERSAVNVELNLTNDAEALKKTVHLGGPGDVIGIQPQAIIRNEPIAGSAEFDPSSMAFVEFYDEDFPWRYTPAIPSATQPDRLRPWLMLLVLKEDEFSWLGDSKPLPSIRINAPVLDMLPEENWAWAHVQVNGELADQDENGDSISVEAALQQVLDQDRDLASARILCPRKLEREQQYFAFLVPTYEVGRLVGLGQEASNIPIQQPSWTPGATEILFPFYHHFSFATGDNSDFETLARRIKPGPVDASAPTIDVSDLYEELGVDTSIEFPNYAMSSFDAMAIDKSKSTANISENTSAKSSMKSSVNNSVKSVQTIPISTSITVVGTTDLSLESALVAPNHEHQWFGDKNLTDERVRLELAKQINEGEDLQETGSASLTEDPVINIPPLYGRWQGLQSSIDPLTGKLSDEKWLPQLNLDPAYRMAAGIGASVVRDNQEHFMQQAWEQIGEVREANQKLNQAQFGKEIGDILYRKHIASQSDVKAMGMMEKLHGKVIADVSNSGSTIHDKIDKSTLANASFDPAFTKLIRKHSPFLKRLNKTLSSQGEIQSNLVEKIADASLAQAAMTTAMKKTMDTEILLNVNMVSDMQTTIQGSSSAVLGGYTIESKNAVAGFDTAVLEQENKKNATLTSEVSFAQNDFITGAERLKSSVQPLASIPKKVYNEVGLQGVPTSARIPSLGSTEPIMAHPEFDVSTFSYMIEKYSDFLSPAMGKMKNNTISLLKINQEFVESYLVGMNHAMGSELLWREYPTDQRGNYFKQFWNTKEHLNSALVPEKNEDISNITSWDEHSKLGSHGASSIDQDGKAVFLIKGELLKQYPNMVVFAQKAEWNAQGQRKLADPTNANNVMFPLFRMGLVDSLIGIAFNLTVTEVRGDITPLGDPDTSGDAGWFLIFKERAGELKFGLDIDNGSGTTTSLSGKNEDDVHWGDVMDLSAAAPKSHINIGNPTSLTNSVWGSNAADMAFILQQKPVYLGFHASSLI